jgi:ferredoxin-nitrite reductase
VIPALEELFEAYVDERNEGERFYEWTRCVENDRLREIMRRADAVVAGGVAHDD